MGWVGIQGKLWDEMEHRMGWIEGGVQGRGISGNCIPQGMKIPRHEQPRAALKGSWRGTGESHEVLGN